MKILYVTFRPYGTMGASASYMFPRLVSEQGDEVKVIALSSKATKGGCLLGDGDDDRDLFEAASLSAIGAEINRLTRVWQPDVIHFFFHPRAFLVSMFCQLSRLFKTGIKKPKYILDIRSPQIVQKQSRSFFRLFDPLKQVSFAAVFAHEEHSIYSQLNQLFKPFFIVPPGVSLERILTKQVSTAQQNRKIQKLVYIGSLSYSRNIVLLIEVIAQTKKLLPEGSAFTLDLIGEGQAVKAINEKITELGLESTVKVIGARPQQELFGILHQYDAGISYVPNEIYEYAPCLKTLEYMAAGLFVLGSNTYGNRLYIRHQETGLLSENTVKDFSVMLADAIVNGLPEVMQRNARKVAVDNAWSNIVKKDLMKAYKALLKC